MKAITLSLLSILFLSTATRAQSKVYYVPLTKGKEISARPIQEYKQSTESKENNQEEKLIIYPTIEFQKIAGIGGAFNEIGGLSLMSLSQDKREAVMSSLFDKQGAQFSVCRTAIGSSDFGVDAYSYSEVPDDYTMSHFSIQREKKSVIPYIKMALKYNPMMSLFASPWSPPAWMKYSGVMDQGKKNLATNKLKTDPKIYEAYALYFTKYVQAYANEGITVNKLLIQNETDVNSNYPSCEMHPDQMYQLIANYLRPTFNKNKIKTEIWAGTFRTYGTLDAIEFAGTPKYRDAVDGIGIQYSQSKYINDLNLLAQGKPTMHTEGNCYDGQNSIEQAFDRLGEVASYVNSGIPNYCYWNMILDETGKSGWGWKQNSLINIDREKKSVTYNPDYAVMALLSKYMQPGAIRIASHAHETLISIKKADKVYLFVQNKSDVEKYYTCVESGKTVARATVPAHSVAVIIY